MARSRPQWRTGQQAGASSSASRWQPPTLEHDERRGEVVRHWSSWYAESGASRWQSVRLVDGPGHGRKERFTLSINPGFAQANVWMRRGDTTMEDMRERYRGHPLAVGSVPAYLLGKVNALSGPENHESIYNMKFETVLGFTLTFGYSRHKSSYESGVTHAWVAFGKNCKEMWKRRHTSIARH
eukprot:1740424-Karenia_brevis.AAC.1